MSIIVCDDCKFEFDVKDVVIEQVHLNEALGVKMEYYQCPECHAEYVITVTDIELRKDIAALKNMKKKYLKMQKAKESVIRLTNYNNRMNSLHKQIIVRTTQLKKEWTNGR